MSRRFHRARGPSSHTFDIILSRISRFEDTMTAATDNLNAKIDALTSAVTDALAQVEAEVQTIKAVPSDDSDIVNASADKISTLTATIRNALAGAKSELAADVTASGALAPASASTAAPVALAGVPITPVSNAGMASTGPAVPSTDNPVIAAQDPTFAETVPGGALAPAPTA